MADRRLPARQGVDFRVAIVCQLSHKDSRSRPSLPPLPSPPPAISPSVSPSAASRLLYSRQTSALSRYVRACIDGRAEFAREILEIRANPPRVS